LDFAEAFALQPLAELFLVVPEPGLEGVDFVVLPVPDCLPVLESAITLISFARFFNPLAKIVCAARMVLYI
jgi:hypothetical protein